MTYKVLNTFKENEHDGFVYQEGKSYPKEGYKADPKRVEFLQKKHPEYGVAFLETPEKEPVTPPDEPKTPPKPKRTTKKAADVE